MKLVCDCGNEEVFEEFDEDEKKKRKECSGFMRMFRFKIASFRFIHFDCHECGRKIKVYNS